MLVDKRQAKKDLKNKALIELQRQKKMDESDDEKIENKDILGAQKEESSENDDDLEEERELIRVAKELKRRKTEEKDDEDEKQLFLNPLLAMSAAKKTIDGATGATDSDDDNIGESSEWSDDDKYEPKETKEEKVARLEKERKLLGKRKKAGIEGDIEQVKDFFKNAPLEEVPVNDMSK